MNTRQSIDLSGPGWRLWLDRDATWEQDELFLPPVELKHLPARPPTGGWGVLERVGSSVQVPGTVEGYHWDDVGDYRGVSWWYRKLDVPDTATGRRIVLRFDAVRLRAEVFVNRRLVGYDLIGNTPFEVDVTERVMVGAENDLAVRVTDPCGNFSWEDFHTHRWGRYPVPASHGFGGLTGGVHLLITEQVHIADVFVQNKPTPTDIDVVVTLHNTTDNESHQDVHLQIVDAADPHNIVYEHPVPHVACLPGETVVSQPLSVPGARLWQLDNPNLYLCRVLLSGGDACDTRFGFRWFAPEDIGSKAVFRLNGKRIVLRSAISWSFWPRTGSVPTPALADKHIRAAKTLGLNMLHFHRAIGAPLVLDRADELGLLYYEEPGGYWCQGGDAFTFAWMRAQLFRMIRRDRNHPSLVIYNLINECTEPPHLRHERDLIDARRLDPSRAITFTSGWNRPGQPDATKLHVRPYDETLHIAGWCDDHHAAGPGVQADDFYRGPNEYRLYTDNRGEIVFWGEEGAIGTPPQLGQIRAALENADNGWDGADYRAWHAAYVGAFEKKGWKDHFRTIDDLARSCGNIAYYYQGRTIENVRLGDNTDGYVINGWECEKWENHSGVVDCFRNFKGDPAILAHYNQPLYVAVKLRQKVASAPATVIADLYVINELERHGAAVLEVRLEDDAGHELWSYRDEVNLAGGETFGQPLLIGLSVDIDQGPGRYFVRARLKQNGSEIASGFDDVFLMDWQSHDLPLNGAVIGPGTVVRDFVQKQTGVKLAALSPHTAELDYVVVEGFDPWPHEIVPGDCLIPAEGTRGGLRGSYYRGVDFDELALRRIDATLDFDWTQGPDPVVGRDNFSVRWEGRLRAPETGPYTFHVTHDDGVRVHLDGKLILDEWHGYDTWAQQRAPLHISPVIELEAGREYDLRVEFYQAPGAGTLRFAWTTPGMRAAADETTTTLLGRVHDQGTTALLLDHGLSWARRLAEAGLIEYHGWLHGGKYWLGSNYFVRAHPLFQDLPTNQALNWEYQSLAHYEAQRYGLLIDGEEPVVGMVTGHQHAVATAVGVIRHGQGQIVLSTLDLLPVIGGPAGPADVARAILCNYLLFARNAEA